MRDYTERLKSDLLEQFKDMPVIEALMETIGEQMTDVYQYFEDLRTLRSLYTATGKQLDGIGDIVGLSRKEAGEIACIQEPVFVLEDEYYRKLLVYKIWKNTNNCTYKDIIKAFRMFWDKPLYYRESSDVPATMIIETDELSPEDNVERLFKAPLIKAAGVAIKVIGYTVTSMGTTENNISSIMGRGYQSTTLPELEVGVDLSGEVHAVPSSHNISQTTLPEMEVIQ